MNIFNDNWLSTVIQLVCSVTVVCVLILVIVISFKPEEEVTTIPVADTTDVIIVDESIGDVVATFDYEQPRQLILEGEPRMVLPQAIIDFSGPKVTYSGDLEVDEAAKIFFDHVMGFVKEARECKNESK